MTECAHCGLPRQGYASVTNNEGEMLEVCHPDSQGLPDCYRRITVYREPIGVLKGKYPLPAGIENIVDEPLSAYSQFINDYSLYSNDPMVCVTHNRFVPCRKKEGCRYSSDPAHVENVRKYQELSE